MSDVHPEVTSPAAVWPWPNSEPPSADDVPAPIEVPPDEQLDAAGGVDDATPSGPVG